MRRMIGRSAVLLLMALVAACQKQETTNVIADNTLVSDEFVDGNSGEFGNLSAPEGDNATASLANTN